MLEIHQVIPSLLTKRHVDTPTAPFSDDLAVVLRFFFDILVFFIREGIHCTSGQRERSKSLDGYMADVIMREHCEYFSR